MILHKASMQQQVNAMDKAIDKLQPRLKKAFLAAIAELKSQVKMRDLTVALTRGNLSMAMAAINVDSLEDLLWGVQLPVDTTSFSDELIAGVSAGAAVTMTTFPQTISANMAFDLLNPNTVRFIENYRVPLIRELTNTTRDAVHGVVRQVLLSGKAPARQAREIRQLVGLTKSQAKAVTNFREQLESQKVLGLTNPSKRRLNAIERRQVARHMRTGDMSQKQIDAMVARYNASLINRRALNIGRTEAVRSSNAGQLETWRQARRKRLLSRDAKKKWLVTHDKRLRPTHRAIPGMNPKGRDIDKVFQTPEGNIMAPPLGTNCRCSMALSSF